MNFEKRYKRLKLAAALNDAWSVTFNRSKGVVSTGDTPSQLKKLIRRGEVKMTAAFTDWNGDKIEVYMSAKKI